MSDNLLYFISIIARALQSPDLERALSDAFHEIKKKGSQKNYAKGYLDFELFMQEVYNRYKFIVTDYTRELIAVLGTGMFEGSRQNKESVLNIIKSHPQWKTEYEAFCCMEAYEDLTRVFPVIAVLGEKEFVGQITFTKVLGRESIDNIVPGNHKIKLVNTGVIIWEGCLTVEKLISSDADNNTNLSLAAGAAIPTSSIDLLDNGEVILHTYAGIESGRIEIELTGQGDYKNG
jgi:uncharacterized protein YutD